MPTSKHGKVRHMLKDGRAVIVKKNPFTIQLTYDTTEYVQPITIGVKPGYNQIAVSASTEKKNSIVLYRSFAPTFPPRFNQEEN